VPFVKLNAGDTANAWAAALPAALSWLWQQLAPPDLRVLFPVSAETHNLITTLPVRPVPHHRVACTPATKPGTIGLPCNKPSPDLARQAEGQTVART
jgi:hypothetical protein